MLTVEYSSDFVRKYKKLTILQKDEIKERIEEFKNLDNHRKLRVHKLKGALSDFSAFSVNYADRIIFSHSRDKKKAFLLDIGNHTIYE